MVSRSLNLVTAILLLSACDGGPDLLVTSVGAPSNSETHAIGSIGYTTVADGVWPPQPVGVSNVQAFQSTAVLEPVRDVKSSNSYTAAMQNSEVLDLIGSHYEVIGQHAAKQKHGSDSSRTLEIFSYEYDQVVTVKIDSDYNVTASVQPATSYQPPESEKEILRSIALAQAHLQQLGHDTGNLIGTALLSHPTTAEFKANGNLFYAHRIIYVTFGRGEGTTPLFRATVDLTDRTVTNAGPL